MNDWKKYHKITNNNQPRKNIVQFLSQYNITGNAIDLGCGSGNDTIFLIKNNWNVTAIDSSNLEKTLRDKLNENEQKRLKFELQEFENLKLTKCDLLIANNSIPFCNKKYFYVMWKEICLNIKCGGYFVGNFFGEKDEWNNQSTNRTFLSKEEVIELFKEFEILKIQEIEINKPTAEGKMKHWHFIEVFAKKN